MGKPGVGKTTLIKELSLSDGFLHWDEAYIRAVERAFNDSGDKGVLEQLTRVYGRVYDVLPEPLQDLEILRHVTHVTGISKDMRHRYLQEYPGSLERMERYLRRYTHDEKRVSTIADWLCFAAERYMLIQRYTEEFHETILVDEGLVSRVGSVFVPPSPSKEIMAEDICDYCDNIPVPDRIILLDASTETCISRMKDRRKGLPLFHDEVSIRSALKRYDTCFEVALDYLSSTEVEVIKLDTEGGLEEVMDSLSSL